MKWHEFDKKRVVTEYRRVKAKHPEFLLVKIESNLAWEGTTTLLPIGVDEPPLMFRVVYTDSYPISPPRVYPINPEIPKEYLGHNWHRWYDGKICYLNPRDWNVNYTAADIIEKVEIWYVNYLAFKNKLVENMPDVGIVDIQLLRG